MRFWNYIHILCEEGSLAKNWIKICLHYHKVTVMLFEILYGKSFTGYLLHKKVALQNCNVPALDFFWVVSFYYIYVVNVNHKIYLLRDHTNTLNWAEVNLETLSLMSFVRMKKKIRVKEFRVIFRCAFLWFQLLYEVSEVVSSWKLRLFIASNCWN